MKFNLPLIVLATTLLTSSCAKTYYIDMTHEGHDKRVVDLRDIATIKYIPITGTDALSQDRDVYNTSTADHTVALTKKSIFILKSSGSGVEAAGLYAFDRDGEFVNKIINDSSIYMVRNFTTDNRGRVYANSLSSHWFFRVFDSQLNRKLLKKGWRDRGQSFDFISKRKIVSVDVNSNLYILPHKRDTITKQPLYAEGSGYIAFYDHHWLSHRIVCPQLIAAKNGVVVPSLLTDTIDFIGRSGKSKPFIINTKIYNTDINVCCKPTEMVKYGLHLTCDYGRDSLWVMWPTLTTKDYIFLTANKRYNSLRNKEPLYFVYDKKADQIYELDKVDHPLKEIPIAFGMPNFVHRNLTYQSDQIVDFISYKYLKENENELPNELKECYLKLTESDSGVLIVVEFK